jgi:DNA-binding MarR family transcriptional regulator
MVTLTDAGAELVKRVNSKFLKACLTLEQQFSKTELESYFNFMDKLNRVFEVYQAKIPELFRE